MNNDPRIEWHLKNSSVKSRLAVKLALAASPRGNAASHEWEALNARHFEAVLNNEKSCAPEWLSQALNEGNGTYKP